ncbi:hypothetical protein ACE3HA_24060, partial [Enterobacter cancerogenus]
MKSNTPRALALQLDATDGAAADGLDTSTVTVTLTDGTSLVSGEAVSLSAASGSAFFTDSGTSQTIVTTGVLGTATTQLASTAAGAVHLAAMLVSSPDVQASADVTFGSGQGSALAAPVLREAAGGSLSLSGLTGDMVHVDIPAWEGMTDGDMVVLDWQGTLANGSAGPAYSPSHTVTLSEAGSTLTLTVDIAQYLTPYAGGVLHLSYTVNGTPSEATDVAVGQDTGTLVPPSVDEASGTVLGADVTAVTLRVSPWAGMAEGDLLMYDWLGNPGAVSLSDGLHVSAALVGQDVTFTLDPDTAVVPFDGGTVEAWYQVTLADSSAVLTSQHATWQVGDAAGLPAPVVEEADAGVIDPETVAGSLHVRISYPGMADGDTLQVVWQGYLADDTPGEEYRPALHVVTEGEATAQVARVIIPVAELDPYQGGRVDVSYSLVRYDSTTETSSAVAEYTVGSTAGAGSLWVAGGRNNGPAFLNRSISTLVALTADGRQPQEAQWQYEGEAESVTGERFADPWPERVLTVRSGADVVRLRPANLAGGQEAVAARQDDGSVVAWGDSRYGGSVPADVVALRDIVAVTGNYYSFAALRQEGSVVAWGDSYNGGSVPADIAALQDIVAVTGSFYSFAALRQDGSVVAWGDSSYGGSVPADIAALRGIVALTGGQGAFAGLRQDGSVVAWGGTNNGGSVPAGIAELRDFVALTGGGYAFAGLRQDGSVVAWGDSSRGGSVPADIAALRDIVTLTGNHHAFAGLRQDGSVVAWGDSYNGGSVPADIAALRDIVTLTGGGFMFAGLRQNGAVVAWGGGGSVTEDIEAPQDTVAVNESFGS